MSAIAIEGLSQPLDQLSTHDRVRAAELAGAMASKFSVEESAFSIVHHDLAEGAPKFTVVYVATSGIDVEGKWTRVRGHDGIELNDADFVVTLGSETIDTRDRMTRSVYDAMIAQVKDRSAVLPDRPFSLDGAVRQSATWLTGEAGRPKLGSYGPIGIFDAIAGCTRELEIGSWYSDQDYMFRPTAALV